MLSTSQLLPNEILQSIFETLNINDILNAARVCRRWRLNSLSPCVWRKLRLSLNENGIFCQVLLHEYKSPLKFMQSTHRKQILSSVKKATTLRVCKSLFTQLQSQLNQIHYLDAPFHDIIDADLIKMLTHLPSLRSLNLERCRYLSVNVIPFISTVSRELKSINLSNTYMDDAALRFLVRNAPNIIELNFSQCPGVTDEGVLGICQYISERVQVLKMAACFAVSRQGFRKGLAELALKATRLKLLDVSGNSVSIDWEIMMEFAALRRTRFEVASILEESGGRQNSGNNLVVDISGDGWEFTKEEVVAIQSHDTSLSLIHNAKMDNHSEEGVKRYLNLLINSY